MRRLAAAFMPHLLRIEFGIIEHSKQAQSCLRLQGDCAPGKHHAALDGTPGRAKTVCPYEGAGMVQGQLLQAKVRVIKSASMADAQADRH